MDQEKIDEFRKKQEDAKRRKEDMDALKNVSQSVNDSANQTKKQLEDVTKDIAKSSDIDEVIKQLKESQLASYLSAGQKSQIIMADSTDLGEAVSSLGTKLDALAESLKEEKTDAQLIKTVRSELAKVVEALNKDTDTEIVNAIQDLKSSFSSIEVNPVVNVPEPIINVDIPKIDFSKLSTDIKAVTTAVKAIKQPNFNIQDLLIATNNVSQSIQSLSFPVPNYVLPFKDINGAATQVQLDINGKLPTTASATLSGSAIPIAGATTAVGVGIVDGSGNQITSFGGGTQYTEGDTDASITGTAMMWEDTADTLRPVSATKPLPVNIISNQSDEYGFQTTATLLAAAVYDSGVLSLSPEFSQVQTHVLASANGTIDIYWYSDAGGTDQIRTLQIAYLSSAGFQMFAAPAFAPYVKYKFTNTGANQTDFYFDTKFLTKALNGQILRVDGTITPTMVGNLTRSVISGETTTGGGAFVNVKVNPSGALSTETELVAGTALAGKFGIDQVTANANEVVTKTGSTTVVSSLTAALPAGTNNIGDVDVLTMPAITGTVTANAGTNLNTSALALESGGNLASVKTNTDKIPSLGQALAAASTPVVLTAAQITTLTPPAAITGFATSALQTQPGVDIGDVTINNAAGGSAVNIQDGGNSITVDGAVTTSGTVTEANSAAILTSTQLLDDTVATLGTTTYTEATTKANIIGAVRRDADTTLVDTTNEVAPLQVNAGGQLKTAVIASALPTGAATSALQTTQDTSINTLLKPANTLTGVTTVSTVTNVSQQSGVAISIGTGVRDAGTQRVTIATNDVVPITDNSGSLTVDAPVGTPAFVRLSDGAAAITTLPVSLASVPSHAVTNAGTFAVQTSATSTGGYTPGKLVSAATTNATSVKASAGTLGHVSASNVNAAARYLKFYNKATAPTVGTDVPVLTYIIPGNTAGAGTNIPLPPQGINFSTGIAFAITTEATDAGSTGVAVSEIVINYAFN